jgi:hypothetical protein
VRRLIFLLALIAPGFIFGQKYELGFDAGLSNYLGDLAPHLMPQNTRETAGFFVKKNMTRWMAFRLGYNYARITGADSLLQSNRLRNLSFKNNLNEFAGIFEFNYKPYAVGNLPETETFYVMFGLALTFHNPKAEYNNITYNLRELHTEGQNKSYSSAVMAVPFGIGYKWDLTRTWVVSTELGFRMTFTDYLDDVSGHYPDVKGLMPVPAHMSDRSVELNDVPLSSAGKQRGDANPYDWYVLATIHLSYRFKPSPCYHF